MSRRLVLGIMSGTSLDGADYALCRIGSDALRLADFWQVKFPVRLRNRLQRAAQGQASSHDVAQLHHDLGRFYARHATQGKCSVRPTLIGLHGQTIFHRPHSTAPATWQIGEPSYLAEACGVPVVSNFRAADLAAGGQGAPLATSFHVRTFAERGAHVCVNNLGGISNVTSIDWRRGSQTRPKVLAFDTGPANLLIDLAARHWSQGRLACDRNGRWAGQGAPSEGLLEGWLKDPFFAQTPPKSTGRERFGEECFARLLDEMEKARLDRFDQLATLTEFTARSLAFNYHRHLPASPDRVVLAGGGSANPVLRAAITRAIQSFSTTVRVEVGTSQEAGWPWQSVEPAAFAWLAWMRIERRRTAFFQTTGAQRAVLLGQITEL